LWPQAMPARHLGHNRARHQRLRHDPSLVVERPTPPPAGPVDHLKAMNLPLRLKRKVKSRHKPISDPQNRIGNLTDQKPSRKVPSEQRLPFSVSRASTIALSAIGSSGSWSAVIAMMGKTTAHSRPR